MQKSLFGFSGIAFGGIALMLALVHFWAGPFSPQPTLEETVAETALSIRDAALAGLRGEEIETVRRQTELDIDQVINIAIPVLGGLAMILAVVGYALRESGRIAIGAVFLGSAAIAFQFLAMALGVLIIAILVAAVISQLGFG